MAIAGNIATFGLFLQMLHQDLYSYLQFFDCARQHYQWMQQRKKMFEMLITLPRRVSCDSRETDFCYSQSL